MLFCGYLCIPWTIPILGFNHRYKMGLLDMGSTFYLKGESLLGRLGFDLVKRFFFWMIGGETWVITPSNPLDVDAKRALKDIFLLGIGKSPHPVFIKGQMSILSWRCILLLFLLLKYNSDSCVLGASGFFLPT